MECHLDFGIMHDCMNNFMVDKNQVPVLGSSLGTARLAMILTTSVNADATKNRPGSAMIRTPVDWGKYVSREGRSTLHI